MNLLLSSSDHQRLQASACRRLNIGAGDHPILYWTNLDCDPEIPADIHAIVPPLPCKDDSLDEIFAGHFLEHLTPNDADIFLQECKRCLVTSGRLGVVVPDTREVVKRYLRGDLDEIEYPRGVWRPIRNLDTLCELFFYSTVQQSHHKWCYDLVTLRLLIERHGFVIECEIDRYKDPRIAVGAWYQCGLDARK